MKQDKIRTDNDEVRVKRETTRIWLGSGIAIFGCVIIVIGIFIPPMGIIDGSVLTAIGEVFGLSGALLGVFSLNRRDNAKIDYMYRHFEEYVKNNDFNYTEDGTSAEEDVQ